MITIQLTDTQGSDTLAVLSPPLTTTPVEGATDVRTLDNNVSTYFTVNKRQWEQEWAYLTEAEFNIIKGYYDRQWTNYQYPLLTISHFSISNVPVRMYIEDQNTIDNCGTVENLKVIFRETTQISEGSS